MASLHSTTRQMLRTLPLADDVVAELAAVQPDWRRHLAANPNLSAAAQTHLWAALEDTSDRTAYVTTGPAARWADLVDDDRLTGRGVEMIVQAGDLPTAAAAVRNHLRRTGRVTLSLAKACSGRGVLPADVIDSLWSARWANPGVGLWMLTFAVPHRCPFTGHRVDAEGRTQLDLDDVVAMLTAAASHLQAGPVDSTRAARHIVDGWPGTIDVAVQHGWAGVAVAAAESPHLRGDVVTSTPAAVAACGNLARAHPGALSGPAGGPVGHDPAGWPAAAVNRLHHLGPWTQGRAALSADLGPDDTFLRYAAAGAIAADPAHEAGRAWAARVSRQAVSAVIDRWVGQPLEPPAARRPRLVDVAPAAPKPAWEAASRLLPSAAHWQAFARLTGSGQPASPATAAAVAAAVG